MKELILILFFSPLLSFATLEVDITIMDPFTNEPIPDVRIQLVNNLDRTNYTGKSRFYVHQVEDFLDTLKLYHPHFEFKQIPAHKHQIHLLDEHVQITIFGYPNEQNLFSIDLKIAEKDKYQKETVELNFNTGGIKVAPFRISNGSETIVYPNTAFHNDLKIQVPIEWLDADFVTADNYSFAFSETPWFHTHYLYQGESNCILGKFEEIKAYDAVIEKYKKELKEKDRKYFLRIEELGNERDSLLAVIEKREYVQMLPPPEEAYLEEPLFLLLDIKAKPPYGKNYLTEAIQSIAKSWKTKYKGKIVLKIKIDRRGTAKYELLYNSKGMKELAMEIGDKLTFTYWTPAEFQGKKVNDYLIISVNINSINRP